MRYCDEALRKRSPVPWINHTLLFRKSDQIEDLVTGVEPLARRTFQGRTAQYTFPFHLSDGGDSPVQSHRHVPFAEALKGLAVVVNVLGTNVP
jgi:hypothetical protein